MEETKINLGKRIDHWAEHNDEHTKRFIEVAEEMK